MRLAYLLALSLASSLPAQASPGARSPLDCGDFTAHATEPVAISVVPLSSQQIGAIQAHSGLPVADSSGRRPDMLVGELAYRGYGISIRSRDPRFLQLVLDNRSGLRHPCDYAVEGPSAWNAFDMDLSRWSLRFVHFPPQVSPGAAVAARRHAAPVLPGHAAGPDWPINVGPAGDYFIGLMYPDDQSDRSVIVAFSGRHEPSPARVLARIPMRLDTLSVLPDIHGPDRYLNLSARTLDGTLILAVLVLPPALHEALGADLASP